MVRGRMVVSVVVACLVAVGMSFAQKPLLSPRDSSEVVINGKKISVNYGAPSKRERVIMGELVPYNKVWRTGANEATAFETEADLEFGDVTLPKGSYTLYTLPSENTWKLIINKQTGQWGTVYNADLDFARVPMKKKMIKPTVERMVLSLKRSASGEGMLTLDWENTSVWISFKVLSDKGSSSTKSPM